MNLVTIPENGDLPEHQVHVDNHVLVEITNASIRLVTIELEYGKDSQQFSDQFDILNTLVERNCPL